MQPPLTSNPGGGLEHCCQIAEISATWRYHLSDRTYLRSVLSDKKIVNIGAFEVFQITVSTSFFPLNIWEVYICKSVLYIIIYLSSPNAFSYIEVKSSAGVGNTERGGEGGDLIWRHCVASASKEVREEEANCCSPPPGL
jgi:hypothetical protein